MIVQFAPETTMPSESPDGIVVFASVSIYQER